MVKIVVVVMLIVMCTFATGFADVSYQTATQYTMPVTPVKDSPVWSTNWQTVDSYPDMTTCQEKLQKMTSERFKWGESLVIVHEVARCEEIND